MGNCIKTRRGGGSNRGAPEYTYTGQHQLIDEGNDNWKIQFKTSGVFTLLKPTEITIDVFLVGGGGGGGMGSRRNAGGGGGGGWTKTLFLKTIEKNIGNAVAIGMGGSGGVGGYADSRILPTSGGITSAFSNATNGGKSPGSSSVGGLGGSSGGSGGYSSPPNGTAGGKGASDGNPGQGTTTCEFRDYTLPEYSGGGGGGGGWTADGGRWGGRYPPTDGVCGKNAGGRGGSGGMGYGGGGGGGTTSDMYSSEQGEAYMAGGDGAQGIVIIRNAR